MLDKAKQGPVSLKTFLTALGGRGKLLLLIFLSLGFGQIPGSALILGPVIIYLGVRLSIKKSAIWMPKSFLKKKIPSYFLVKVIKQILRFLKFMKHWSCPRYVWATQHRITRILNGWMIACVGLSLTISPPVPLTGFVAFAAIFLIAIGMLNDDGVYIMLGYICTLAYLVLAFFLLKYMSVTDMIHWVRQIASL